MRMQQPEPSDGETLLIEKVVVETAVPVSNHERFAGEAGYAEWDRSQWVGDGQEPPDSSELPPPASTEPRWTKWEWVGEGQGEPGLRRGQPAEAMPEGDNALSGHRHNPGMAHWGGRRF